MDYFSIKAKNFDKLERRVINAKNIANAIKSQIDIKKEFSVLDFGAGTGLLLEEFVNDVKKIYAVDISPSMSEVLRGKNFPNVEVLELDLTKRNLDLKVDLIISSMTIHHIKDVNLLFKKFFNLLNKNGFIAIADLDKEDGSFHTINTGVEHFGFDRDEFINYAKNAGFSDIEIKTASVIKKDKNYGVFLLTAKKV
jgi:SAM-dependent methyltransferase